MKDPMSFVSMWFSIIIVLVVLAGAFAFTFTSLMSDTLYGGRRVGLIVIFFGYAIYRGIRIYQVLKTKNNEED